MIGANTSVMAAIAMRDQRETDSTGAKTIAAGSGTRFFDLPNTWACGQDACERVQLTSPVGTGDWSEVVTPAAR